MSNDNYYEHHRWQTLQVLAQADRRAEERDEQTMTVAELYAEAQIHATLALAAATHDVAFHIERGYITDPLAGQKTRLTDPWAAEQS